MTVQVQRTCLPRHRQNTPKWRKRTLVVQVNIRTGLACFSGIREGEDGH
jgi:hypothetical protein